MDKIIAVIFNTEEDAYRGVKALTELHDEGSITLYASGVVKKQADGRVTVLEESDEGPLGTGVGLLTGSLIGFLGGPVGAVVGASVGTAGGMIFDLAKLGISEDFLFDIGRNLQPDKAAVVAEVWEEWVTPVDTRMESVGGTVFRRVRADIEDAQFERDVEAFNAEIDQLEAEIKTANAERKAKLQAKLDQAKAKLHETQERAKKSVEDTKHEMEAKIKSLQDQVAKTNAETKSKIEKQIAQMKDDHKKRNEKLRQAWELVKEAAAV